MCLVGFVDDFNVAHMGFKIFRRNLSNLTFSHCTAGKQHSDGIIWRTRIDFFHRNWHSRLYLFKTEVFHSSTICAKLHHTRRIATDDRDICLFTLLLQHFLRQIRIEQNRNIPTSNDGEKCDNPVVAGWSGNSNMMIFDIFANKETCRLKNII